jgi:hypothetical protein
VSAPGRQASQDSTSILSASTGTVQVRIRWFKMG